MEFINCTPHEINLNDGRSFAPSGICPRVTQTHGPIVNDICEIIFGEIEGLPPPKEGVIYIVSALVLAAAKDRKDLVAPATNHPCTRRHGGKIISVECFIR